MNWRRGLLLAGIHLAVAGAMVLMIEARDEKAMREVDEGIMERAVEAAIKPPEAPKPANPAPAPAAPETSADPENLEAEQTVSFTPNPCGMWVHSLPQEVVIQLADMPADLLAGWDDICPPAWSLAGRFRGKWTWPPTASSMAAQRPISVGLCLLLTLQWFLMGAFPLVRTPRWRNWWREPGSLITVCAVSACLFALIHPIDVVARLFALPAMLAWFWWFGLLVWKLIRAAWRMVPGTTIKAA